MNSLDDNYKLLDSLMGIDPESAVVPPMRPPEEKPVQADPALLDLLAGKGPKKEPVNYSKETAKKEYKASPPSSSAIEATLDKMAGRPSKHSKGESGPVEADPSLLDLLAGKGEQGVMTSATPSADARMSPIGPEGYAKIKDTLPSNERKQVAESASRVSPKASALQRSMPIVDQVAEQITPPMDVNSKGETVEEQTKKGLDALENELWTGALIGGAPLLIGALMGDMGKGATVGGNALTDYEQRLYKEKQAKKAREEAAKLAANKPLTKANVMEYTDAQGNPVIGRVEDAIGQTPYEKDTFHLSEKKALEKYKNYLKEKESKGDFKDEQALRKEYSNHVVTKRTARMGQSLARMQALAKDRTGASDLTMLISYMKILDPTSVVSPREAATAENAGAVPDAIRNMYNRILEGKDQGLPTTLRNNFLRHAQQMYNGQQKIQNEIDSTFKTIAGRNKIDYRNVTITPRTQVKPYEVPEDGKQNYGIIHQKGWLYLKQPDGTYEPIKKVES